MPLAALDLHKQSIQAVTADDHGRITFRGRFPATRVALEATFNTWAIVALLQPFVAEVVVSNPLQTRAIAFAKIKSDKVDADTLLHLLRCDYLPRVWVPDEQTRLLRQLCTERANLSADRTRVKNRIHAVLHQRLLQPPLPDLFSPAGLAWLRDLPLDPHGRASLDRHLRQLDALEAELAALGDQLARHAYSLEDHRGVRFSRSARTPS
ncbi:MAG: transposase [Bryobacteraceae bacterium]